MTRDLDRSSPAGQAGIAPSIRDLRPRQGRSHVRGDPFMPLWNKTIPELLAETVEQAGDSDAAIFTAEQLRWSWRDLANVADQLASGLLALGLRRGDRVGVCSPNRPEWVALQFASARIGAILVAINPAYRLEELEFALNKVGVKALLVAERFKSSDYVAMMRQLAPELDSAPPGELNASRLPELKICIRTGKESTAGMYRYDDVLKMGGQTGRHELDRHSDRLDPDDPINIQFTSGTTGAPKGATLTHVNIVNNGRFVASTIRLGRDDRLCIPVPLYHCFGMVMGVLGCSSVGACMVFPGEGFDARSTLDALSTERCTALYAVPTMFVAMMEQLDEIPIDLTSLRTGIMAGAPCPIEIMRRVIGDMNMAEVTIAYGMTETSPVSFQSHVDDPIDKRVSTVGRVHPHVEVKIIDASGAIVPVGVQGELCTRGYSVMHGYWDDVGATSASIDESGWMHSGDLAAIDDNGFCAITGRVKDMIIRGGENIFPREIEEFLFSHPAIREVQVFGVPDMRFGEEVCAWIVLKDGQDATAESIRDFCRGRIAHYKIPKHVRFKSELPLTVTGKPKKFVMRDQMIKELDP